MSFSKLMKGKALRKHSLRGKIAASVLLKLFISGNEGCHNKDKAGFWSYLTFTMNTAAMTLFFFMSLYAEVSCQYTNTF